MGMCEIIDKGTLGAQLFTDLKSKKYKPATEFTLTLTKKALTENMQSDNACFEACAVILKSLGWKKIILELNEEAKEYLDRFIQEIEINNLKNKIDEVERKNKERIKKHIRKKIYVFSSEERHCLRFLYRVSRFYTQYKEKKWFIVDENLSSLFENFLNDIEKKQINLINDTPTRNAKTNPKYPESTVEALMADHKNNVFWEALNGKTNDQKISRQLPVGLYLGNHTKGKEFFPTGHIDLWTGNTEEIQVVELKAENPMVGIITEIFFYSNFVRDLVWEHGAFTMNPPSKTEKVEKLRGYDTLFENAAEIKKINGIMLADSYDQLIKNDKGILEVLSDNAIKEGPKITYSKASYEITEIKDKDGIKKKP